MIENEHGFEDGIGIVDGTQVILMTKPSVYGKQYYNKKSQYSISCMIVNNHNYKILDMLIGSPGFAHDSCIFINSKL